MHSRLHISCLRSLPKKNQRTITSTHNLQKQVTHGRLYRISEHFPAFSSESEPLGSSSTSNYSYSRTTVEDKAAGAEVKLASQNPKKRAGRKKFRETRHPVYRGLRKRDNGKWVCEVREPIKKSRVWLGTHPTAEMAARAHDVAALAFRGRSACLKFADSVWRLPVPKSNNIQDVQSAAAEAAEAFRHPEEHTVQNVETKELPESQFYMDEEEMLEMPGFFESMAEGLMVTPPHTTGQYSCGDNLDLYADESLWSF